MVACGEAELSIRALASRLGRRLLLVHADSGIIWAWFGGGEDPDRIASGELEPLTDNGVRAAVGEPAGGIGGWRSTHRQTLATFALLLRSDRSLLHYPDVALLASVAQDELLVDWLRGSVLGPLTREDDGPDLTRTLRSYFGSSRKASCAAADLGVSRHTVTRRLREVEERLGQPLEVIGPRLELALELQELLRASPPARGLEGCPQPIP